MKQKRIKNPTPEIGKIYYGCIRKALYSLHEESQLYVTFFECAITVNGITDFYWGFLPEDFDTEEEAKNYLENELGLAVAVTFKKSEKGHFIIDEIRSLKK